MARIEGKKNSGKWSSAQDTGASSADTPNMLKVQDTDI